MRFHEITEEDFTRTQGAALMTVLNHLQAEHGIGSKVAFADIVAAMKRAGYPFNYYVFQDLFNKVPSIQNMIGTHSEQEVTIGKEPGPEGEANQPPPETKVDQMAGRAAAKAINK